MGMHILVSWIVFTITTMVILFHCKWNNHLCIVNCVEIYTLLVKL